MAIENTCHVPECFNRVGPDGTLCELHEELQDQGKLDAADENLKDAMDHPPFLSPEADDPKGDSDDNRKV